MTEVPIPKADPSAFKAGYVAIVGEPNVGKSTLMNSLLGQKISIVTRKPQTTRQRVLGILSLDGGQVIFLDTPGLLEPKYLLHEKMMESARRALEDADIVLLMTEVSRGSEIPRAVRTGVLEPFRGKPLIAVINKVDTRPREELLPIIGALARMNVFRHIIPVSALKGENLDDLRETLLRELPVHPPLYPTDIVSEHPERFFAAELIRECIFEHFQEEVPYSTAVEIREFKEREEGKTYILADIVVERTSQKGIIIGKQGSSLKSVGASARTKIEEFLGTPVYLELFVKVGERWRQNAGWMKRLGYEAG
ncbi:MAG: GTPase Era [Bacteroidota bacterium]